MLFRSKAPKWAISATVELQNTEKAAKEDDVRRKVEALVYERDLKVKAGLK